MNDTDRFLAEKLMGWILGPDPEYPEDIWWLTKDGNLAEHPTDWSPTTRIDQALGNSEPGTVVGEMKAKGYFLDLHIHDQYTLARFLKRGKDKVYTGFESTTIFVTKDIVGSKGSGPAFNRELDTPAQAISEAAKAALEAINE